MKYRSSLTKKYPIIGAVDNTLAEMEFKCGQAIPWKDAETPFFGT